MQIEVVSVGRVKQRFVLDGEQEYLPRMKPWAKVSVRELDPSFDLPPNEQIKREGELFLKQLSGNEFLVILDEKGKRFTSPALSAFMGEKMSSGNSSFVFAIGGAFGWREEVKKRANLLLSLSDLTFPYQLTRLVLIEQIYRSLSILKGQPYHK